MDKPCTVAYSLRGRQDEKQYTKSCKSNHPENPDPDKRRYEQIQTVQEKDFMYIERLITQPLTHPQLRTHPPTPSLTKRRGDGKSLSFQERDLG